MNGTDFPPVTEDTFCKYVLYYEINNSRVRIWDLIILIPNALFVLFLVVRFNKAQLKLRATSSPIFLTFYTLVWGNVIISLVRCAVSMTVNAAMPLGGMVDKVLWVMVRFFLLATEMSVVIFGLAFGHLDSRSSIRYVLLATSLLSLAFTVTQGTLEIVMPDDMFHVDTRDYDLFGHGGMLFWFTSSLVFALIYFLILLLPWIPLREYLALPTKLSFYLYVLLLALLDTTQAVGAGLLAWGNMQSGLCVVDVTTWLYFSLYTPLVYHTFLSEFFSVSQPSIMFSYKAQMDEPMDEDQVSLPHQQSFSSLKTDSDYIYQQSNSVYDSTLFEAGGTTPMNPVYSASLQSPDSIASVKNLYSPAALGIDGFLQTRKRAKEQFTSYSDKFRTKMNEFAASQENMIFTEDLKNMVHLAEPTDLKLILSMIQKFNSQNTELRFGSYVFGPVVMRMFHFLDAPKEALECFYDPKNDGFFDQHVSYHILLDLLYSHEMYDEMYKIFDRLQQKQINMSKFPKYSVVMILAACYKQNTPKSLEYASKLWSDMASTGSVPVRRACTFFAALALKQGAPHIAMESISSQKQHYVTIRNIKAMALADMGRVEDTLPILRTVLDIDSPMQKDKHTFFEETVIRVRQAVEKSKNKDVQKEFDDIAKALKDRGLIDSNNSLDQLLNSEIQKQKPMDQSQQSRGPFQFKRPQLGPRQKKRIV